MVLNFPKTSLFIQCILLVVCFVGCKEAERTIYKKPLNTKLPKHYIASKTEKLNERLAIKVKPLCDSVYSDDVLPFNVVLINLSTDTISIITGDRTIKIEAIQDTTANLRIDSLEKQTGMKILVSDFQDFLYPDVAKDIVTTSLFNKPSTRSTILPRDSLTETVNFNFATRAGNHRPFRLTYDTENYKLLIDTTKIKIPVPLIATGKLTSGPFFIDVVEPIKGD